MQDAVHQQNNLYGYMDTCLSNVDAIYLIIGDKKRRLVPRIIQSSKIKGRIFIVCKVIDFSIVVNLQTSSKFETNLPLLKIFNRIKLILYSR